MPASHLCYTFTHGFNAATRSHRALAFIEKYYQFARNPDFRTPSNTWYAPDAIGYHTDGTLLPNNAAIIAEAKGFLKPFAWVDMDVHVIRLIPGMTVREPVVDVEDGRIVEDEERRVKGDQVLLETTTIFYLKGDGPDHHAVRVPRFVCLLIGEAEASEGTDGLQIFEAKSWWDSWILIQEMDKRKEGEVRSEKSTEFGIHHTHTKGEEIYRATDETSGLPGAPVNVGYESSQNANTTKTELLTKV